MKKFILEWETCYCEDYDTVGTAIVEAETADEAKRKYEESHRMTIVYNVSEYNEREDEYVQ